MSWLYLTLLGIVGCFVLLYLLSSQPKKGATIASALGAKPWLWIVGLVALVVVLSVYRHSPTKGGDAPPRPVPVADPSVSGSQILEGGGPFKVEARKKTPWISIVGRWIHIVPGDGVFTYDLQDSNGRIRTFKFSAGVFYEILPSGKLEKLTDQSGRLWRQAVYERFSAEEDVTFTVNSSNQ